MSSTVKKSLIFTGILLVVFTIYTICVLRVDVAPIGVENTDIGFSTINGAFKEAIGMNSVFYNISKYLGYLSFALVGLFAILALAQMITRKGILKADKDLYILGVFYIFVIICYVFFEMVVVNYRPWDLGEGLEASYPSSHTMLAICVFSTGAFQLKSRIKDEKIRKICVAVCVLVMALIIVCRTLSGVHWFTDILGGILLSAFLVSEYVSMILMYRDKI